VADKEPPLKRVVKKALDVLREGKPAREAPITADERLVFGRLQLITAKPMMYVLNVEEGSAATGNAHSAKAEAFAKSRGMPSVVISAAIEARGGAAAPGDPGRRIPHVAGPQGNRPRPRRPCGLRAARPRDASSPSAPRKHAPGPCAAKPARPRPAASSHTDFEKGFIRAETIAYDDYVSLKVSPARADAGKLRLEGQGVLGAGRRRLPLPLQRLSTGVIHAREALRPARHGQARLFPDRRDHQREAGADRRTSAARCERQDGREGNFEAQVEQVFKNLGLR